MSLCLQTHWHSCRYFRVRIRQCTLLVTRRAAAVTRLAYSPRAAAESVPVELLRGARQAGVLERRRQQMYQRRQQQQKQRGNFGIRPGASGEQRRLIVGPSRRQSDTHSRLLPATTVLQPLFCHRPLDAVSQVGVALRGGGGGEVVLMDELFLSVARHNHSLDYSNRSILAPARLFRIVPVAHGFAQGRGERFQRMQHEPRGVQLDAHVRRLHASTAALTSQSHATRDPSKAHGHDRRRLTAQPSIAYRTLAFRSECRDGGAAGGE